VLSFYCSRLSLANSDMSTVWSEGHDARRKQLKRVSQNQRTQRFPYRAGLGNVKGMVRCDCSMNTKSSSVLADFFPDAVDRRRQASDLSFSV
jgi:hypothetical protein